MNWLIQTEIDRKRWDTCVKNAPQEHPTGYSDFLDIVSPRWQGVVLGDYQAVFPMPVKTKGVITLLYQPPFMQRIRMFGEIWHYESRRMDKLIQKNVILTDACIDASFLLPGRPRNNCIRPAYKPAEISTFTAHHRRNFKKSCLQSLFITTGKQVSHLIEIFNHNKPDTVLSKKEGQILKQLADKYLSTGALQILEVYKGQDLLGGIITLESEQVKTLLFTAQTERGRDLGALYYVLGNTILDTDKTFDFEGSINPGLKRFYLGFGGIEEPYVHMRNKPMRILRKFI